MSGFYDFFLIPDDFFTEFLKSPPNTATSPNQIGKQVSFTKTSLQNQARHAPGCGAESAGGHALCSSTGTFNSAVLIQKFLLSSILGFYRLVFTQRNAYLFIPFHQEVLSTCNCD